MSGCLLGHHAHPEIAPLAISPRAPCTVKDNDDLNRGIGRRIRRRREALGLSQLALATLCGKRTNSWTAGVEAGRIQLSVGQLVHLSEVLEMEPAELLGLEARQAASRGPVAPEDRSCGGPPHPALGALREGLWLPRDQLLTVWPAAIVNQGQLPLAGSVCIATISLASPTTGSRAAWLVPAREGGRELRFTVLPRPSHWRQRQKLATVDKAHEVLMFLPG